MSDVRALLDDLRDEGDALDALVSAEHDWSRPTPASGWSIAHQIGHLAWTDVAALTAIRDPERFRADVASLVDPATGPDPDTFVDAGAAEFAALPDLAERWRDGRAALLDALAAVPAGTRIDWYGPPMSVASMATARIMETWAHGEDVAEALGVVRPPTDRLRHVAHIGVRTRDFAYLVHGEPAPDVEFRVELTTPDGRIWAWGPDDAAERVTGTASDFCRVVTQRVHVDDTSLVADGPAAAHWLTIAQAFAGPPGAGRAAAGAQGGDR